MLPVDLFILASLVFQLFLNVFLSEPMVLCLLDEVQFVIFCSCR